MPRPTTAQLAYGSCTVILSTLAMLLLSQTSSGVAIAVIAVSALALGLLVAMTVPLPKPATAQKGTGARVQARVSMPRETVPATVSAEPVREPAER
ncbi:hypothetical protein ACFS5L_36620 [Streptomyces phyllanthi]|uniref:Uncharacterized protein n=1 Tax=Streptomyces phyllanthi TaxID=1803180 RepID=A0A5N8WG40_9ACTN|nr:hypothetical protein [Streptomyces phyllanthi]MPY45826.1 hypothetical protein [Streptomyces phyllanthi]